jgi:threonine synthase
MKYESTRGRAKKVSAAQAIKSGIASDGGLFVPLKLAHIDYYKYLDMTYQQRSFNIFKEYLGGFDDDEIDECIRNAYNDKNFDTANIVKIVRLNGNMSILELWHGPTCAFKDIALQILPYFLKIALKKTGEKKDLMILVATSGDTGKAALEGFKDVDRTDIVVFFPKDGVSLIQELQMTSQNGKNVTVVKVDGNFDDAQNGVKEIFADRDISDLASENGFIMTSANSINWGRLLPQVVYYISAYADMVKDKTIEDGEKINICIPTGNFGNILAAYYAKAMGLPVNKLICASNENNILTEFFMTGIYDINRKFYKTISPSMDILVSSNLERLLFELSGRNARLVSQWMKGLKNSGRYQVDEKTQKKMSSIFFAGYCNDEDTLGTIKEIYEKFGCLVDTHTAVAIDVYDKYIVSTQDLSKTLIASTASPYKFCRSVARAILGSEASDNRTETELMKMLRDKTGISIPVGLQELDGRPVLHETVCRKDEMKDLIIKHIVEKGEEKQP